MTGAVLYVSCERDADLWPLSRESLVRAGLTWPVYVALDRDRPWTSEQCESAAKSDPFTFWPDRPQTGGNLTRRPYWRWLGETLGSLHRMGYELTLKIDSDTLVSWGQTWRDGVAEMEADSGAMVLGQSGFRRGRHMVAGAAMLIRNRAAERLFRMGATEWHRSRWEDQINEAGCRPHRDLAEDCALSAAAIKLGGLRKVSSWMARKRHQTDRTRAGFVEYGVLPASDRAVTMAADLEANQHWADSAYGLPGWHDWELCSTAG